MARTWSGEIPPEWGLSPDSVAVRQTGGGAVLHGLDLCLSLFFSRASFPPGSRNWSRFYENLHSAFAEFLLWCGHPTRMQSRCSPLPPCGGTAKTDHANLCFREPVRGDLMMGEAKVLGGALSIGRKGILYQGSLKVPEKRPDVLSGLFEEWYCSMGRERIDRALLMEAEQIGTFGTVCQD
ncbi:MAG: hypothetical protein D084_Lepto4C00050G0003 [Leptospirillum sp. Group IV 'UBA BS']|nr:MAG: hypothetical protein D084_Lepto4C00050G0003 [Leptospirillum sp. Group IV 'UBA BS']